LTGLLTKRGILAARLLGDLIRLRQRHLGSADIAFGYLHLGQVIVVDGFPVMHFWQHLPDSVCCVNASPSLSYH